MPVIVTRPEQEAGPWVERLRAKGVDVIALPLIRIGPAPDPRALAEAQGRTGEYDAVMFVSANAVRGFFPPGVSLPAHVRAWSPGPGTAEALRDAGIAAGCIDSPADDADQFDSEALWDIVKPQVVPGSRILLVRGANGGRDWLARTAEAAGAKVDTVAAYSRGKPVWSTAELEAARRSASDGSVWLFSSSEGIANLLELLPSQGWQSARAVATHPRIAEAARAAGFGVVRACRPAFDEVLASLQWAG